MYAGGGSSKPTLLWIEMHAVNGAAHALRARTLLDAATRCHTDGRHLTRCSARRSTSERVGTRCAQSKRARSTSRLCAQTGQRESLRGSRRIGRGEGTASGMQGRGTHTHTRTRTHTRTHARHTRRTRHTHTLAHTPTPRFAPRAHRSSHKAHAQRTLTHANTRPHNAHTIHSPHVVASRLASPPPPVTRCAFPSY